MTRTSPSAAAMTPLYLTLPFLLSYSLPPSSSFSFFFLFLFFLLAFLFSFRVCEDVKKALQSPSASLHSTTSFPSLFLRPRCHHSHSFLSSSSSSS